MPRDPKNTGGDERRYEHKIPSRDELLAAMEQAGQPLTLEALAPRLGIRTEQHRRALEARMRAYLAANPKDKGGGHRYEFGVAGLDPAAERRRFAAYSERFAIPVE